MSRLSAEAVAVVAGLIACESQDVNRAGIYADDGTWDEIRAAFPIEAFRDWAQAHPYDGEGVGYDPEGGW